MYFGTKPYGLEGYIRNHGDGSSMYRGEDFGQPNTIHDGDVLSNGWTIVGEPFEGGNGSVGLRFNNGEYRLVPARIPLQLVSDKPGVFPVELRTGHILQTGCVILDEPRGIGSVEWHDGQDEVELKLTGGWEGHEITVPSDLAIAVFDEMYPPSSDTVLGAFALEQTLGMREVARQNLPKLGQLGIDI
jgi:hypothetical protein